MGLACKLIHTKRWGILDAPRVAVGRLRGLRKEMVKSTEITIIDQLHDKSVHCSGSSSLNNACSFSSTPHKFLQKIVKSMVVFTYIYYFYFSVSTT